MKNLIMLIAQAVVDNPEHVVVREYGGDHSKILELEVAQADIGKVIGRQGRTADAMRTILSNAAAKNHSRAILEIVEHKWDSRNTYDHPSSRIRELL